MRDHHREPNETKMRKYLQKWTMPQKNMRKTTRRPSHRPCDSSAAPVLRTKSPWCNVNRKENATRATTRRVLAPNKRARCFCDSYKHQRSPTCTTYSWSCPRCSAECLFDRLLRNDPVELQHRVWDIASSSRTLRLGPSCDKMEFANQIWTVLEAFFGAGQTST